MSQLYIVLNDDHQLKWDEAKYDPKIGFSLGVSTRLSISESDKFSLTPQLQFLNLGAKHDDKTNIRDLDPAFKPINYTVNIYYLSLPVTVDYKISDFLSVNLGSQIGYSLNRDIRLQSNVDKTFNHRFDYGVRAGLGFKITDKIDAQLVFYNGFGNVEQVQPASYPDNWRSRNRYLSFEISYRISKIVPSAF